MPRRDVTTRQRLAALISTGYKQAPARVGLDVYVLRANRKQAHELTIGAAVACLYEIVGTRRSLITIWDIAP